MRNIFQYLSLFKNMHHPLYIWKVENPLCQRREDFSIAVQVILHCLLAIVFCNSNLYL
jgi:hypothetical protein